LENTGNGAAGSTPARRICSKGGNLAAEAAGKRCYLYIVKKLQRSRLLEGVWIVNKFSAAF
jgi:hypothetical protein